MGEWEHPAPGSWRFADPVPSAWSRLGYLSIDAAFPTDIEHLTNTHTLGGVVLLPQFRGRTRAQKALRLPRALMVIIRDELRAVRALFGGGAGKEVASDGAASNSSTWDTLFQPVYVGDRTSAARARAS